MDIIRRSQLGDERAFEALYEQYKNLVYRTAVLMLGNPADAEDVLQEVFVKVHRSLDQYDPGKGAFTTWLYRITVNQSVNRKRWYQRRPRLLPLMMADKPAPESLQERVADDDSMQKALQTLSEKLRVVVVLHYYWNLPYYDISQILEIPPGTVKSRMHTALARLRSQLEEEAIDSGLIDAREVES